MTNDDNNWDENRDEIVVREIIAADKQAHSAPGFSAERRAIVLARWQQEMSRFHKPVDSRQDFWRDLRGEFVSGIQQLLRPVPGAAMLACALFGVSLGVSGIATTTVVPEDEFAVYAQDVFLSDSFLSEEG